MNIFNIIYHSSSTDEYTVVETDDAKSIYVPSGNNRATDKSLQHNIHSILEEKKLCPNDEAIDFLSAAISIYTADQLVPRSSYGFNNWSRYFRLHLPVVDSHKWEQAKIYFEDALNFLTGDHWELFFRSRSSTFTPPEECNSNTISKVSLLSGGLDSFIGVTDLLASGCDVALVGHHKSQGFENMTQSKVIDLLKSEYKDRSIEDFLFNAQPIQHNNKYGKESSSRSRSILFIGLGISVANSYGDNVPLYIPENGLISLNIPLTHSRVGSSSTRTTHPHFLQLLRKALTALGINNTIINPYQFMTKGEMVRGTKNPQFINRYFNETVSCAHPNSKNVNVKRTNTNEQKNCGYCTPCIIRRAALNFAGLDDVKHYVYKFNDSQLPYKDDIGRDYRAFKMAVARLKKTKPKFSLEVLRSGPLPNKKEDLYKYTRVYERGMKEVEELLK
ncbi:Qat anti-phage system QueC-like protein QatC [Marinoscillum sp.]|uniref:Qat anti-phage system QueC-like protein QatC n=1 Tax=Marinoscillum sp. TaxID=2024838 RepID=UPI003BAC1CB1